MPESSLSTALTALQRRYGPQAIRRADRVEAVDRWPTGLPALDSSVLPGGLPRGRITVLSAAVPQGPSGRLSLLQSLTAVSSGRGEVGYVDPAGTVDPGFLADLGADLASCLVIHPGRGRWGRAMAMGRSLMVAGLPWLAIALDGPGQPPAHSWDHVLAALVEAVAARGAVCLIAAPAPLGRPLAHAASLVLTCEAAGWQRAHGDVAGLRLRVTASKCKVGTPGGTVSLLLRYPRPYAIGEVVGLPTVVAPPLQPAAAALPAVAAAPVA